METLLLSLTQLVLGISSVQPEIPAALLQPHGKAVLGVQASASLTPEGAELPSEQTPESDATVGSASDSNGQGGRSGDFSLKLKRGPLGEAFVINESPEEDLRENFRKEDFRRISQIPIIKQPTTSISDTPIRPSAEPAPALRPNISPPVTGGPSDRDLLKPNDGTGTPIFRRDPVLQRIPAPRDDDQAPVREPKDPNARPKLHDHGNEFPTDINDISPAATTDDQMPPKSGTVSATITYEEQKNEQPPGGETLSIFTALDQALVKSPRAAALRSLLPVTQSELARATEQPGPDWTYDNGVAAEQTRRTGAVFNFEPPWKLVFRLLAAKRLIEQTKQDLLSQLWSLRAEVRLAYTEVVVAQETLETLNSLYDLAHRLMVVSEKRFQAGDVPELDMLKARLAESQYDVERRVGLRRVIRAKQQLNVIMGRKPESPLTIPRLPPFLKSSDIAEAANAHNILLPDFSSRIAVLEYYLDIAMKHRYELKSLDRQIAVNKAQLRNSYGNIVPSPQFWMGSSQTGNPPTGPRLGSYYFGVNVPSNITSFQQGDIAKYKAVARQLKYQTGALKNVITSEVASAYNNVLAARQKLRIYQEHVLADSYEVARLARRSYEVGQSDITSTIQAQQNNVQIRTQYLEAIQLYQQAFTELERACGTPLLEADD
jgi:cobalt-zinc-cadmium efflux system outer membrane protein